MASQRDVTAFLPSTCRLLKLRRPEQGPSSKPLNRCSQSQVRAELRTCKQCKQTFSAVDNHERACRFHSGLYTGDSKRKGDWVASYSAGAGTAERFWWYVSETVRKSRPASVMFDADFRRDARIRRCCGEKDEDSPGCCVEPHRGYD